MLGFSNLFFLSFYLDYSQITYHIIIVSGIQYSDSTLPFNTPFSSQQVLSLISIPYLTRPPTHLPSVAITLFSVVKSLFPGLHLSLFSPLLVSFLNSTHK